MRGAVVAPQPIAVSEGINVLKRGGNAVDAAITAALVQGIVDPSMAGIGGFGDMLIYIQDQEEPIEISFHGRVGSRATPDVFAPYVIEQIRGHAERYLVKDYINQIGYKSVTVPGTVMGFYEAQIRFGTYDWADVFQPAIRYCKEGFPLPGEVHDRWRQIEKHGHVPGIKRLAATPASAAIYLKNGDLYPPGAIIVNPDYGRTLEKLAKEGPDLFYKGEIAEIIADDFQRNEGFITREDLANYKLMVDRPLRDIYRDFYVFSAHPPSSGIQLIQLLNILEGLDLQSMGHLSSHYIHHVARAMQISFTDRANFMGDPEFVDVPVERWISKEYAKECRQRVLSGEKIVVPKIKPRESSSTTHICVMDGEGNAVSLTHTLGSASGVITPGLGFTYNNCMYQYNPLPGHPNSIQPGKRRITGMAPTIVFRDNKPWMVAGGPGGTRILTAVMHTFINVVEFGLTAFEAVSAPRFQCEGEDIEMESRLYFLVRDELKAMGWKLAPSAYALDNGFARAYAIINRGENKGIEGGADPRAGGCAAILR